MTELLDRLTRRTKRILTVTFEIAVDDYRGQIEPDHLLLSMVYDADSVAGKVLHGMGLDTERVEAAMLARKPAWLDEDEETYEDEKADKASEIRFSETSIKVLDNSLREADALKHHSIGSEHFLLALASVDDENLRGLLADLGLEPDTIRERVMDALRQYAEQKADPPASLWQRLTRLFG